MAEFKQIIDDALDILKFDGAVQDTLAELREKWGAQVPAQIGRASCRERVYVLV